MKYAIVKFPDHSSDCPYANGQIDILQSELLLVLILSFCVQSCSHRLRML